MIKIIPDSYAGLIREEDDGTYLCIPNTWGKPLFLNKTMFLVFTMCDGSTMKDVTTRMKAMYPSISSKRIAEGVFRAVWYLKNIGILKIEGEESKVEQNESMKFAMPEENEFQAICDYIISVLMDESADKFLFLDAGIEREKKFQIKLLYQVSRIRLSHASDREIFYIYSKEGSKIIDGVIGISFHYTKRVAYIQTLVANNADIAKIMIKLLSEKLKEHRVSRIKCLLTRRKIDEPYIEIFRDFGFQEEACLIDEALFGDILVYSRSVN